MLPIALFSSSSFRANPCRWSWLLVLSGLLVPLSARADAALDRLIEEGAPHPDSGPVVLHVAAAADKTIGLEIQAGEIVPAEARPFTPTSEDEIKAKNPDKPKLAWEGGKPSWVPAGHEVKRGKNKLGDWSRATGLLWAQGFQGQSLELKAVDDPRAYRISVDGAAPISPVAVHRKSKPNGIALGNGAFCSQHFIYLELSEHLKPGSTYEIRLHGLNTREASVSYRHAPSAVRTEAVHVSHLGYRPKDPFKRAYLSLWKGTGGATDFGTKAEFELLDASGAVAYRGAIRLGVGADRSEPFSERRNHSSTNVYHLDFSDFAEPGQYRVHVPGLGLSYPFEIGDRVWQEAFRVSMQGFLHHRSGIALGPPFTDYRRPRAFHPDDGLKVFKTDAQIWDGESDAIKASLTRLMGDSLDASKLDVHPGAWGGYMDAGDWDRRSQHLFSSLRHLELLELFPDYFAETALALPPGETANALPDLLDEALWNLAFYRRLQEADGGVGGGVESTAHPRPVERSWEETLLVGAFRPDPETSYRYAAVAARAARLLKGLDETLAADYADSSRLAWVWAEANAEEQIAAAVARKAKAAKNAAARTSSMRTLAAIERYRLSGETAYHDIVSEGAEAAFRSADIAFAYALIPAGSADPQLMTAARASLLQQADEAVKISEGNGFNLAISSSWIPMMGYTSIWSTPGGAGDPVLPRAHYLTGEQIYLRTLVAACQYPGGANPMNMSYTTGLGPEDRQPRTPLHLDHRRSGQKPPAGITVYGQSDPSKGYGFDAFAHQWYLNRFGGVPSKQWPTAEAYIDLGSWPAMNEYTVHQNFSPTSYCWGYLAARP